MIRGDDNGNSDPRVTYLVRLSVSRETNHGAGKAMTYDCEEVFEVSVRCESHDVAIRRATSAVDQALPEGEYP